MFIIILLVIYKLFFKNIVEEVMITTSEYTLRDVQISLQPSAKEMMGMDSLCFTSPWNEQDYH